MSHPAGNFNAHRAIAQMMATLRRLRSTAHLLATAKESAGYGDPREIAAIRGKRAAYGELLTKFQGIISSVKAEPAQAAKKLRNYLKK